LPIHSRGDGLDVVIFGLRREKEALCSFLFPFCAGCCARGISRCAWRWVPEPFKSRIEPILRGKDLENALVKLKKAVNAWADKNI